MINSYPCIVLEGVTSQQELGYLQKSFSKQTVASLPFYMTAFGKFKEIGYIELHKDSVLGLDYINPNYKIWLYKSDDDKVLIDQNNDETLIKLIRL